MTTPRLSKFRLFSAASVVFLAAAAWSGMVARSNGDAFVADSSSKSFGELPVGVDFPIVFQITNRAARSLYVLGAASGGSAEGCLSVDGPPMEIPGGQSRLVTVHVHTSAAGPFDDEVVLWTNNPDQLELRLTIQGFVVAVKE